MPNLTGQSIGRYHILEQLGEGGMATVYKAYDTRLERNVAFKVLRTGLFGSEIIEQILKRFEREAKSLAKLSHSNIVNILDYGEYGNSPYLVMEYLPGGTLKQRLGQQILWQEAIQTLLPIAQGLAYAHRHNVIHRDVKPANILLKEENIPVLTDFGIAKLLEGVEGHTLTASGVGIGTPEYMAPEQGIGASTIDARADIYSLGIVLYEMITGRKPYIADTPMAVVLKQMTDPLPRPMDFVPDLPEEVEHILLKALSKEPDGRYQNMDAMIGAMENLFADTQNMKESAPSKRAQKKNTLQAKLFVAIGATVVILAFVLGSPWVIQQLSSAPNTKPTPTKLLAVPLSTITLTNPTKTLTTSPTSTLTRTIRPKPTTTTIPSWVVNFANPILAYLSNRQPDFEDDFESKSSAWAVAEWCADWRMKYENGKLLVDECYIQYQRDSFNDYVADVTLSLVSQKGEIGMKFRNGLCHIVFSQNFGMEASCEKVINGKMTTTDIFYKDYNLHNSGAAHLRLIAKGGRFAFYLDGEPAGYFEEDAINTGKQISLTVEVGGTIGTFDDFKIWDISEVEIP